MLYDFTGQGETMDFKLCSVPMLMSRNKSEDYKGMVREQLTTLMGFLKSEELIYVNPFDASGNLRQNFVLNASDSSSEAIELFKKAIPAWFNYLDTGGDVKNLSTLEKALASLRGK